MRLAQTLMAVGLILLAGLVIWLLRTPASSPVEQARLVTLADAATPRPEVKPFELEGSGTVYDISLHDSAELKVLLDRLETLAKQPHPQDSQPDIALVLHGPELNFFAIRNYPSYRELVDLAAKLDAFRVIEVKACRTRMQALELRPEDIPAFIEIVPYGPGEVDRLEAEGYVRM